MSTDKARRVRASRGAALANLKHGRLELVDVLRKPPSELLGVDLYVVLMKCPRMGRIRARDVCERARVWPHVTIGELSKPQRLALIDSLPKKVS